MAITINGTGSITGLTAGGLPDGSVVASDLASSLDLTGKTVTLPSGTGGQVLQVVTNTTENIGSQAVTVNTDTVFSYLTVDITPISQNSTMIVSYHLPGEVQYNDMIYNNSIMLSRRVNGTHNYIRPAAASARQLTLSQPYSGYADFNNSSTMEVFSIYNYPDVHNTTSQITYFPAYRTTQGGNWYYNRTVGDGDNNAHERSRSWMVVMEVA